MTDVLVVLAGVALIGFIAWFFFGKREETPVAGGQDIDIQVAGGYHPSTIRIPLAVPVRLHFTRTDPSSCLEEVVLGDFRQRAFLPLNKKTTLEITAPKPGTYRFVCGMNMQHGTLIVENTPNAH